MYALKLALRPWKKSGIGQWCSIMTLGFILTALAFAVNLSRSLSTLEKKLGHDSVATIYLTSQQEEEKKQAIVDEIRLKLGSAAETVQRVTPDEFLRTIEKQHPELAAEVNSLGSDLKLITPEYVTVRGAVSPEALNAVKAIAGVEGADLSLERMKPLLDQIRTFRRMMVGLTGLLIGCFFVVMSLLSQVNQSLHRESEALIAQLGGSRLQIRVPALADLALTGGLAGLISIFLWSISDVAMLRTLGSWSPLFRDLPRMASLQLVLLPVVGLALGAMLGLVRGLKVRT